MADYTDLLGSSARQPAQKPRSNYSDDLLGGTQGGIPGAPGGQPPADNTAGFMDYMPMSMLAKPYQDIRDIAAEGLQEDFPYFKVPKSVAERSERTSQANLNLAPFAMGGAAGAGGAALAKRIIGSGAISGGHDVAQQAMETGEVDPAQAGMATALGGVGQAGGELIGKGLSKLANRGIAPDIERLDPAKVQELVEASKRQRIQLTPAETTGLPSLMQQQKQLSNTMGAGDDMADFLRMRADKQTAPAIDRFLEGVSPVEGAEVAGDLTRAASKGAMSTVEANRAAQAKPIYEKAFATAKSVKIAPVVKDIDRRLRTAKGPVRNAIENARSYLFDGGNLDQRLEGLHGAKLAIDDLIEGRGADAVGRVAKRELTQIKGKLLNAMDTASPDYGRARAIFGDLSPGVERIHEGLPGTIAKLKDSQLKNVAAKLFERGRSPGPRAVAEARKQLQAADPQAWQAIKRAFLEEKWIDASKQTLGSQGAPVNAGAKFRLALMGSPKQRAILEAALDPQELRAMDDLSKVLEATGRVKPIGSDTAWNIEANKNAKNRASKMVTRIMRMGTVNVLKDAAQRWDDANFISHSRELVRMITSPEGMSLLRELNQLSPHEEFARAILGRAIVIGTGEQALESDDFQAFIDSKGQP